MRRLAILALGSAFVACSFSGAPPTGSGDDAGSADAELPTAPCGTPGALRSRFDDGDELLFRRIESTGTIAFAGQLDLQAPNSGIDDIATDYAVDLVGHAVSAEVSAAVVGQGDAEFFAMVDDHRFGFVLTSTSIRGFIDEEIGESFAFDRSEHRFLRIREDADDVYLEAAGDDKSFQELQRGALKLPAPVLVGFTLRSSNGDVSVSFDNLNTYAPLARWCPPSFTDDFADDDLDPHWIRQNGDRCDQLIEAGGRAQFGQQAGPTPTECVNRIGAGHELLGSAVSMEAPNISVPVGASIQWRVLLQATAPDGAMARISFLENELCTIAIPADNPTGIPDVCVPYEAGPHRFWRLSMPSADEVLFETSPDSATWTPIATADAPFDGRFVNLRIGTASIYLENDKDFFVESFNESP